jgi:hypothetical protein
MNGDFPFTHGKVPFRMEISHSCMTTHILNGDFMSILNGHEWTPEWDLPVAEWEIMARRPFTSSIQEEVVLIHFSYHLNGDKCVTRTDRQTSI